MSTSSLYNFLPYNFHADTRTHPARIAALGHFYGMSPKPIEECSILDIGCAEGANILPIAENYPKCTILGFDNAHKQVEVANQIKHALNLDNISFLEADIADIDLGGQVFDYILAHGFLSWIPQSLHSALFKCIKRHLAPQGIALVTFNTYPGWHAKHALRDFLLTYTDANKPLPERILEAKSLIDHLLKFQPTLDSPFVNAQKATLEDIQNRPLKYIAHDYFSQENTAYYFKDFIHISQSHGLQFLGDTELKRDLTYQENPLWRTFGTAQVQSIEEEHQRFDFFKDYPCRLTLLCHDDIELSAYPKPNATMSFHISSYLRLPKSETTFSLDADLSFKSTEQIIHPKTSECKALLWNLSKQFPRSVFAAELLTQAHNMLQGSTDPDQEAILKYAQIIFAYFSLNQIQLWTSPPKVSDAIALRPKISKLNQYLAHSTEYALINQHHIVVSMDTEERALAAYLDGTNTHEDLRIKMGWDPKKLAKVLETFRICAFLIE